MEEAFQITAARAELQLLAGDALWFNLDLKKKGCGVVGGATRGNRGTGQGTRGGKQDRSGTTQGTRDGTQDRRGTTDGTRGGT